MVIINTFLRKRYCLTLKIVLFQMTSEYSNLEFDRFKVVLDEVVQRHAPIKMRYLRANQAPLINKKINHEELTSQK